MLSKKQNMNIKHLKTIPGYILGLISMQNVFYGFKVSNTYINIAYIFACFLLLWYILLNPKKIEHAINQLDKDFLPFIIMIPISIVPYFFIINAIPEIRWSSYFAGIVLFVLGLIFYFCILAFSEDEEGMQKGLWHGLLLNVLVSILQLVFFVHGSYFSLYKSFPQPFYYISIPWNAAVNAGFVGVVNCIYSYRAQGLFLECSYFVGATSIAIAVLFNGKHKVKTLNYISGLLLILIGMSGSGNFVIYLGILLLHPIITRLFLRKSSNRKHKSISIKDMILMMAAIPLAAYGATILFRLIDFESVFKGAIFGIQTANLLDSSNLTRYNSMIVALQKALEHPFGVGYGMGPSILLTSGKTITTFNYFLTISLELGFGGLFAYLLFITSTEIKLLFKAPTAYSIGLAVSIVSLCIVQFANGTGLTPLTWLLFGFCTIEKNKRMQENRICNKVYSNGT